MKPLLKAALSLIALIPVAAHADTVSSFSFNATFTNGAVGTGFVTIDTTTGSVTNVDATVSPLTGSAFVFNGVPNGQSVVTGGTPEYRAYTYDSGNDFLDLIFPTSSLIGYAGGSLCTSPVSCSPDLTGYFDANLGGISAVTATLTAEPTSVTPEPSSLVLAATGLASAAGLARRKLST